MDLTRRTAVSPAPHSSTPSHLSNWPAVVVTSLPSPLIRTNLIAAKLDDGHYIGYLYNNQFGVEEQIRIIWTPDRLVGCQDLPVLAGERTVEMIWKIQTISLFPDFPPCHDGQFRCDNALCIPARWRCDGYKVGPEKYKLISSDHLIPPGLH